MNDICTEERFLKDVSEHKMVVVRDDGVHRHIRFQKPGAYCMHFDLITWPGYLCYTGDMGTYVFCRLDDMFQFFRTDREHQHLRNGETLYVNHGYWAEKVVAQDKCDGVTEFDEDKFNRVIIEMLVDWIREHRNQTTKDERRDLWDSVMSDVIGADNDSGGFRKTCAAYDFHHEIRRGRGFEFHDLFERSFDRYAYRFVWCCYALAWGISQYDATKGVADALQ